MRGGRGRGEERRGGWGECSRYTERWLKIERNCNETEECEEEGERELREEGKVECSVEKEGYWYHGDTFSSINHVF